MTSPLPFHFLVGHVPFCMPAAGSITDIGEGTLHPLQLDELDHLMAWVWRVKTWEARVTGLTVGESEFADYVFEFANHLRPGEPAPEGPVDLVCGTGLEVTQTFMRTDQFGQQAEFLLQIAGLDSALREPTSADDRDGPWYPRLEVELELLFPPGSLPASEPVARSTEGADLAGTLEVDGITAPLFTGFAGQIFTGWTADVTLQPVEHWPEFS